MQAAIEDGTSGVRYRFLEEIGRGRRAVVWRAEDRVLGRCVAVKRGHSSADTPLLLEEARRLACVASPHVVGLFDILTTPDVALVLELLDGEALRARLRAQGRLETAAVAPLVRDLLRGLVAIHRAGLVHEDIKPENLWITPEGRLVLLDLGAAGDGTALYAAPEIGLGEAATPATDVYAAASVAYEMFCGRTPFDSAAADELVTRKRTQVAPPAQRAGASVSPAVEAWLARALDARAERRFPDAATALAAWCEATLLEAQAAPTPEAGTTILNAPAWAATLELWNAVVAGHGGALGLAGERGVGKTTVVRRWCANARAHGGVALEVRMHSSSRRAPFAAWRAAVRAALPQLGRDGTRLMPRRARDAATELAQQERVVRALGRVAAARPVAIAADELERCDAATRRLVLRLARQAQGLRVAVLVTVDAAAAGQVAAATREALAALVPVRELELPDAETWRGCIASALGVASVSDTLLAHLQQHSGGNPLFARLLLAELRVEGALRRSGEGWVFRPEVAAGGVPRGVAGLFEARLRGLDAELRELLHVAAVQGARFDAAPLARRFGRPEIEIHDRLQRLATRHGLLRREATAWGFRPPLLAAHLVAGLAPERFREEHAALATALVDIDPQADARIGAHLYHAGLGARALPHLERAGRAALARHEAGAALASLDLACRAADLEIASEEDVVRRLELGLLRTQALQRLSAWDAAADELEPLLVLARGWGQDGAETRALRAQGEIEYARSRFDEAIARWLEAQVCAERAGDEAQIHELALQVGNIHFERGELEPAAVEYERVLAYANRTGNVELEARAANNVALIESIQGRKQRAVQFFNRSLERFRALGRVDAMARLNQNIGQIYLEFGNWAEARNFFQRAMQEGEASGQQGLLAVACLDCAEANIRLGSHAEAAAAVERALSISRECGDEVGMANAHRLQAGLAAAAGDTAAAEARLLESIETLQRLGQALQLGLCWKDLGAVRLQAGRTAPAATALEQARQLFAALDATQHVADVEVLQARCKAVPACRP